MLYHNQKHPTIASSTSWDEFLQKGASEILNLDITPKVLERFRLDPEVLRAMEVRPGTWVHLAVLQVVGEQSLVDEHLGSALDFHRSVTDQAAAHLNLLAENTFRTPWLATKILSKDPFVAQNAATSLIRHIVTTKPGNRTSFENHVFATEALWQNLEDFPKEDLPILVWRGRGK